MFNICSTMCLPQGSHIFLNLKSHDFFMTFENPRMFFSEMLFHEMWATLYGKNRTSNKTIQENHSTFHHFLAIVILLHDIFQTWKLTLNVPWLFQVFHENPMPNMMTHWIPYLLKMSTLQLPTTFPTFCWPNLTTVYQPNTIYFLY